MSKFQTKFLLTHLMCGQAIVVKQAYITKCLNFCKKSNISRSKLTVYVADTPIQSGSISTKTII